MSDIDTQEDLTKTKQGDIQSSGSGKVATDDDDFHIDAQLPDFDSLKTMLNIPEPMQPIPPRKPGVIEPDDFLQQSDDAYVCHDADMTIVEAFKIFKETYLDNLGYSANYFAERAGIKKVRFKLFIQGRRIPTQEEIDLIMKTTGVLDTERAAKRSIAVDHAIKADRAIKYLRTEMLKPSVRR